MPKEVVLTALGNRIEYATTDGKGFITGKREDITEQAVAAVFNFLKREFEEKNPEGKGYGRNYGEHGKLLFVKPNTEIRWKEEPREDNPRVLSDYRNVYDNWYVKSCAKSNEEPVSFSIYLKTAPIHQVEKLKQMLASGQKP